MVYTDLPPNMKKLRGDAAKEAKDLREEGKHTRIRVVGTKIVLEFRDKPKRGEEPGAWTQKVFGSPWWKLIVFMRLIMSHGTS